MYIKSIEWVNEVAQEADVVISNNSYDLVCFAHPFKYSLCEKLDDPLHCIFVNDFYLSKESRLLIEKRKAYYEYFIRGEVYDKRNAIVRVNEIKFHLGDFPIPRDINEGDIVEFTVLRLDIY